MPQFDESLDWVVPNPSLLLAMFHLRAAKHLDQGPLPSSWLPGPLQESARGPESWLLAKSPRACAPVGTATFAFQGWSYCRTDRRVGSEFAPAAEVSWKAAPPLVIARSNRDEVLHQTQRATLPRNPMLELLVSIPHRPATLGLFQAPIDRPKSAGRLPA